MPNSKRIAGNDAARIEMMKMSLAVHDATGVAVVSRLGVASSVCSEIVRRWATTREREPLKAGMAAPLFDKGPTT